MTVAFDVLDKISKRVAYDVGHGLQDDVRQEIWVKFLLYPPPNRAYAWRAAKSARNSLWRHEQRWWRLRDEGEGALCAGLGVRVKVLAAANARRVVMPEEERLERLRANHRRWYHLNLDDARANSRERVRRHRARQAVAA